GLYFNGGTGHLRHTTVSYGGAWNNVSRSSILAQNVTAGEVRIEHSEIISSSEVGFPDYGIYIDNARMVISNTLIANNGDDPVTDKAIWMDAGDMHQTLLVGNTFSANASSRVLINGGTLAGSAFLGTNEGLEGFELDGILRVPAGLTLTLDANTIILGRSNAYLFIEGGHIDALGTSSQPVILTSSSDTGPEEWAGVRFEGGTGYFNHTTIRYGGIWNVLAFANLAVQDVTNGEVLLENSQIYGVATSLGNDYGIYAQNSNVTIRNTSVISNGSSASDAGIYATVNSHIVLENSIVSDNAGTGFLLENGVGDITCSSVIDNQGDGIALTGTGTNFTALSAYIFGNIGLGLNNQTPDLADARFTWWGAADGPGGAGPG
ncbi:MAG: right-handed parallel beta-helix repeat-containing protein, partial [Chloroflexi bacterium]|nr:right-handed parallel beta-helix repeat-containing protein [Chloroflexota bacterium]